MAEWMKTPFSKRQYGWIFFELKRNIIFYVQITWKINQTTAIKKLVCYVYNADLDTHSPLMLTSAKFKLNVTLFITTGTEWRGGIHFSYYSWWYDGRDLVLDAVQCRSPSSSVVDFPPDKALNPAVLHAHIHSATGVYFFFQESPKFGWIGRVQILKSLIFRIQIQNFEKYKKSEKYVKTRSNSKNIGGEIFSNLDHFVGYNSS
jgi:hypothetical protein